MKLTQYLGFVSIPKVRDWDVKELRRLARTKMSYFWLYLNFELILKEELE